MLKLLALFACSMQGGSPEAGPEAPTADPSAASLRTADDRDAAPVVGAEGGRVEAGLLEQHAELLQDPSLRDRDRQRARHQTSPGTRVMFAPTCESFCSMRS